MKLARIAAGLIVEIIDLPANAILEECFHPDLVAEIEHVPDEALAGWVRSGDGWAAPSSPPIDLVAYAAERRWQNEGAGIAVSGVPVATDDRSKLMITGARVAALADPDWSTIWHGADGNTYPVDAAAMIVISNAVQAHVNASFAAFATVRAAIAAGNITTTAEIDAAFAV